MTLTSSAMLVCILLLIVTRINQVAAVDNATHADAVVVLGCAVQEDGQPSPALRARIENGIRVWRATGSTYLLLTGGVGKHPPAEAAVMATVAAQEGVPASAMIEDTTAHRTEDSAMVCTEMARQRGWKRVVLAGLGPVAPAACPASLRRRRPVARHSSVACPQLTRLD